MSKPLIPKNTLTLTVAICLMYSLNGGLRGSYGVLLNPLMESAGLSYADVSFIFAVAQLVFGGLQPLFGLLALRTSAKTVLLMGLGLTAAGLVITPFASGFIPLLVAFGIIQASGAAALSFGLLLGIVSPQVPQEKAPIVSGYLNASAGVGTTILPPILQYLLAAAGLFGALMFVGIPSLLFIPIALWIASGSGAKQVGGTAEVEEEKIGGIAMLKEAFNDWGYRFLMIGFATCGFHMAILETHFFNQVTAWGFSRETAAMLFTVYGALTMTGSALAGYLVTKVRKSLVLGTLYGTRVFLALAVFIMPASLFAIIPFCIVLGLTSDSTVSPTSNILLDRFGPKKLATLFGLLFLLHQTGAFISAWAGGLAVAYTGGYEVLWIADAVLCSIASAASYAIKD